MLPDTLPAALSVTDHGTVDCFLRVEDIFNRARAKKNPQTSLAELDRGIREWLAKAFERRVPIHMLTLQVVYGPVSYQRKARIVEGRDPLTMKEFDLNRFSRRVGWKADLTGLDACRQLGKLNLPSSRLTDDDVQVLALLKSLIWIGLSGNEKISDRALVAISNCPVKHLDLRGTAVSDVGLANLAPAQLEYLDLGWTQIGDAGIRHIGAIAPLKMLDLDAGTSLTNNCIADICRLSDLEILCLNGTGIDDQGIVQLACLKKLRALGVDRCQKVSAAAVVELKRLLPDLRVVHEGKMSWSINEEKDICVHAHSLGRT